MNTETPNNVFACEICAEDMNYKVQHVSGDNFLLALIGLLFIYNVLNYENDRLSCTALESRGNFIIAMIFGWMSFSERTR